MWPALCQSAGRNSGGGIIITIKRSICIINLQSNSWAIYLWQMTNPCDHLSRTCLWGLHICAKYSISLCKNICRKHVCQWLQYHHVCPAVQQLRLWTAAVSSRSFTLGGVFVYLDGDPSGGSFGMAKLWAMLQLSSARWKCEWKRLKCLLIWVKSTVSTYA